jgi:predicted RNA binding protein YcfA (HicA-like mRNA interferase family)
MKVRELKKLLKDDGWTPRPGKGDQTVFRKPGHIPVVVDGADGKEVPTGTLHSILKSAGLK